MQRNLQLNIKERIKRKGITVAEVERRAGLNKTTIQNIVLGRSKNPGIEIISALAKELECSIDELISPESEPQKTKVMKLDWQEPIFTAAIQYVSNFLKKHSISSPLERVIKCATEIYAYSLKSKLQNNIDEQFAEWITERNFMS